MTQPLRPGGEPTTSRATKSDVRFFVLTVVAILVIGASIAAILWVLTRQGPDQTQRRTEYVAFSAGNAEGPGPSQAKVTRARFHGNSETRLLTVT